MGEITNGNGDVGIQPGDKVRLKANPGRIGILGNETDGPPTRQRVLVNFLDGDEQFVLKASLEKVEKLASGPYAMIARGRYPPSRRDALDLPSLPNPNV